MRADYVEAVLTCVERIPAGRVTTYGAIADVVARQLGVGGPRLVGAVMSLHGGSVPWWRVIRADGSLPSCHEGGARERHLAEGTALRASGRVDLTHAFWQP